MIVIYDLMLTTVNVLHETQGETRQQEKPQALTQTRGQTRLYRELFPYPCIMIMITSLISRSGYDIALNSTSQKRAIKFIEILYSCYMHYCECDQGCDKKN